jgi:dTDP-4-dehydrorhamnose reductase
MTMTRILLTGGTGLLAKSLLESSPADFDLFATYYPDRSLTGVDPRVQNLVDVRDPAQVNAVFDEVRPDVVIHTASIGNVDYAEKHRQEAWDVNVGGTQNMLAGCARHQARMIFISSNAVFDGEHPFYAEDDQVHPINYYGQLKVEGEQVVAQSGVASAIVRPILMYGWPYAGERANPVTWWVSSLEQGKPLKVVDDVHSKPLLAPNCAEAIWVILRGNRTGTYHIAGADHVTLYQFAVETARVFDLDERLIEPVPSSYFPEIAPRPRDTSFKTDRMAEQLQVRPVGIREGLLYLKRMRP